MSIQVYSQNDIMKGYRIEGDTLIFSFDRRDYDKATSDTFGNKKDFEDLNIKGVVVSGEFNNWSKRDWSMTKLDENRYELRKSIRDFTDEFSWEFKFVVNNEYWAEPSRRDFNVARAIKNGHRLPVYNLKMFTAYPKENGNTIFTLNGYKNAKKVIISGSFNRWDEKLFTMNKTESGWSLTLQIKPGKYQYKFIVDNKWIEDNTNSNRTLNEFGGFNSVIDVKGKVTFLLDGYAHAQKVVLSGSFNDWSEKEYLMTKTKAGWSYTLLLSGGKYHYKFIINDEWLLDPANPVREYDYNGNINSVCMVK